MLKRALGYDFQETRVEKSDKDGTKVRRRDGENCFERTTGKIHTKVRPFDSEPTGKSVYSGYKVYGRETWV